MPPFSMTESLCFFSRGKYYANMSGQTSPATCPLGGEEEEEKEGEEGGEGWTDKAYRFGVGRLCGLGKSNILT